VDVSRPLDLQVDVSILRA